jgi:hypothetical protein
MHIPQPKYQRDQVVYYASVEAVKKSIPCPDCLGSKVWTCTAPSGEEHKVACPRCQGGYSTSGMLEKLPDLHYNEYEARACAYTVSEIEVRASTKPDAHYGANSIIYWSGNGGRGEDTLFLTEEQALEHGRADAAKRNASPQPTSERTYARFFATLNFGVGMAKLASDTAWNARYALGCMARAFEQVVKDHEYVHSDLHKDPRWEEFKESVQSNVRWEHDYRLGNHGAGLLVALHEYLQDPVPGTASFEKLREQYEAADRELPMARIVLEKKPAPESFL